MTSEQFAFLVGGFATNQWLSEQLEKRLSDFNLNICKPDTQTWEFRSYDEAGSNAGYVPTGTKQSRLGQFRSMWTIL